MTIYDKMFFSHHGRWRSVQAGWLDFDIKCVLVVASIWGEKCHCNCTGRNGCLWLHASEIWMFGNHHSSRACPLETLGNERGSERIGTCPTTFDERLTRRRCRWCEDVTPNDSPTWIGGVLMLRFRSAMEFQYDVPFCMQRPSLLICQSDDYCTWAGYLPLRVRLCENCKVPVGSIHTFGYPQTIPKMTLRYSSFFWRSIICANSICAQKWPFHMIGICIHNHSYISNWFQVRLLSILFYLQAH